MSYSVKSRMKWRSEWGSKLLLTQVAVIKCLKRRESKLIELCARTELHMDHMIWFNHALKLMLLSHILSFLGTIGIRKSMKYIFRPFQMTSNLFQHVIIYFWIINWKKIVIIRIVIFWMLGHQSLHFIDSVHYIRRAWIRSYDITHISRPELR